jgi:L-lactate utilization protein LutB
MTHDRAAHLQLDLFKVQIAPCGRSNAPTCELERNPPAGCWTCLRCGCIAPVTIEFHDIARQTRDEIRDSGERGLSAHSQ